jgi:hypothetical protein
MHPVVLLLIVLLSYAPTASPQVVAKRNPFPVGARVDVMWSGNWYPAMVKEVRGDGRWLIGYDGYGSSWDQEVGVDRIRARGAPAPVNAGTGGNNGGRPALQNPVLSAFRVGSEVEVLSSGTWYAARVKEVRPNGRWFIAYDGYTSNWDEEVGADRIRAKGAPTNAGKNPAPARQPEAALTWPAKPGQGGAPIEGAYLQLVVYSYPYTSYNYVSWFFTRNGRFSQGPNGGVNLQELSTREKAGRYEGTYSVQGDKLVMAWADGSSPWVLTGYRGTQTLPIGAGATRQSAFPKGWRLDGSYEGGASIGGGSMSSSSSLNFRRDGTYSRGSVVNVSSTGRTTEVSGGVTGGATGTYQFDEYTLTLRENSTERKYTVFAYGSRDAAGRPEQIFWEGVLVKRLDR